MSGGAFNTFVYNKRVYNAPLVVEPAPEVPLVAEQKKAAGSGTYLIPEREKKKRPPHWIRDDEELLLIIS